MLLPIQINQPFNLITTYSHVILYLCILVIIAIALLGIARLYFFKNACNTSFYRHVGEEPLVSIHLPICNEPPELVLKTIAGVRALHYDNFELIVISNNTADESLWLPVQKEINSLPENFKFYNKPAIKGYKAGALNFALQYVAETTEFIFTIDSDYIVEPDALTIAVGTIKKNDVDLLQFPQSYRNISMETSGLEVNYKHYFDCYLSSSKSKIMALPTGTLSLLDIKIFKDGYQWPTDSITEDASLGVDLLKKKKKIGFCNKVIGKGTMPTEPEDYEKQFKRWVFGNFQVLKKVWHNNGLSFKNRLHLTILLTAWLNLLGVMFIVLSLAIPAIFLRPYIATHIYLIGSLSVLLHCIFQFLIFLNISKMNVIKSWNGFLVHLGLLEIGAFYWMGYYINNQKPFARTNKFMAEHSKTNSFYILPVLFFLIAVFMFFIDDFFLGSIILAFGLQFCYAKFHRDKELFWSKFNLYKKG